MNGRGPEHERFPLPPALAKIPPGRQRLPRQFVEQNQRNRIILAALDVFGGKGYAASTVHDLITAASLSRTTFYKYFEDKEACFRAAHEEILAWLEDEAREAARGVSDWRRAVLSVSERLIVLLSEDPRLARICTVEWVLGGDEARSRQEVALGELAAALRKGRAERSSGRSLPQALETFVLGGAVSVLSRAVVYGLEPDVESLVRELAEAILTPYLGAEEARRATCARS
jgi:AcrR family transcriptional regulator